MSMAFWARSNQDGRFRRIQCPKSDAWQCGHQCLFKNCNKENSKSVKNWNSWEIWRKIQISAEQACIMEKSQWRDMSMSEDRNPVCTYSGANSCKKFGFVTTSIELNEHDFWARCTSESATKTSSSSTGLPLKPKSVKTWETEVWRWFLLYNEKPIVDVSMQLTTRCSKQGWIKISDNVLLHDRSLWSRPNTAVSKRSITSESCTSNLTEVQISA